MNRFSRRPPHLQDFLADFDQRPDGAPLPEIQLLKARASWLFEKGLSPFLLKICTYLDQF